MGLAASAEAQLASVAIRATGSVFATSAFMNGSTTWAWSLFAIAHFVILYVLGIPPITNNDELIGYFITWPLIAIGFGLLGTLGFWLLDLAELLPWKRYFAGTLNVNYGMRPSGIALILNTIWWILIVGGSVVPFEIFVFSIPWLAVVLAVGVPALLYLALWAIYRYLYTGNEALFGSQAHVTRSILFPGVVHVVTNLVLGLIVILAVDTYNWAWIASLVILGVFLIVTLIYWWFAHSMWDPSLPNRPPRTGDMSVPLVKPASDMEPLVPASGADQQPVEGQLRAGIAYRGRQTAASAVFGNNH